MTTPLSTVHGSSYGLNAQVDANGCDSTNATCGPPPTDQDSGAREVTIPPVEITGDAGARQLVKKHDETVGAPDCSLESKTAAHSCAKAGLAAASGALLSTTGVGVAIGFAVTLSESITCGKDLRALYDCKLP